MALNGISTSTYKADRQTAKLNLAQTKRQAGGDTTKPYYRANNVYDITELPTKYAAGNNDTNDVVDNPNTGGLKQGRPWAP